MKKIEPKSFVTLKYKMQIKLPDGKVEEKEEENFSFIYGIERQVSSLEKALLGAKEGDRLTVYIPPKELYGERDPDLIREIPKKGLIKQRIKEGQYYRQIKKGVLVSFKVLEIRSKTILADFNPPMAGISAIMKLEVTSVRKATKKEISSAMEAEIKRKAGCG